MNILKGKTRLAAGLLLFTLAANPLAVNAAEQAQATESTVSVTEKAAAHKADAKSATKKKSNG